MIKTKADFLEGRLLSSQSEQFEVFFKLWLAGKSRFLQYELLFSQLSKRKQHNGKNKKFQIR